MMNAHRAAFVLGLLASFVVACSGDDTERTSSAPMKTGATAGAAGGAAATAEAAATEASACPTDIAAPKRLVSDGNATSLQVVGDQIYYQSAGAVMKVGLDGSGPTTVFTSTSLSHAFVDGTSLLVVESPDGPDAVVRVIPLADAPKAAGSTAEKPALDAVALPETWNAAGTKVFAADGNAFFLVADQKKGQAIYSLAHTEKDTALTKLAEPEDAVVTSVQATSDALWFVRDNARIYKTPHRVLQDDGTLAAAPEEDIAPKEQFKVDAAGCDLAIAGPAAFCIRAGTIEKRDLNGANPTTLFDIAKSRVKSGFGSGVVVNDHLVLRSAFSGSAEAEPQKAGIRDLALSGGSEKILACGRTPIGALAATPTQVVWTEQGENAGIWLAPR